MNSEERKGVAARVWLWVQSFWQQPNGSTCHVYLLISGMTLVFAFVFAQAGANIVFIVETLVLGLMIASLVKNAEWSERNLSILRNVLLDMAFEECRCRRKSHCHVCQARAALKEHFPEAIVTEIRERLSEYRDDDGRWVLNNLPFNPNGKIGPIPEDLDLTAYLSPAELEWHRAAGQLPEAHKVNPP